MNTLGNKLYYRFMHMALPYNINISVDNRNHIHIWLEKYCKRNHISYVENANDNTFMVDEEELPSHLLPMGRMILTTVEITFKSKRQRAYLIGKHNRLFPDKTIKH